MFETRAELEDKKQNLYDLSHSLFLKVFLRELCWVLTNVLLLPILPQVYRKAVGQMSQGLIRRLTVLSQYEEALVKINATAADRLTALKAKPQAAIQRDMLSICNDPFTVAQQLTHIELVRTP